MLTDRIDRIKKVIETELPNCEITIRTLDDPLYRGFFIQFNAKVTPLAAQELEK